MDTEISYLILSVMVPVKKYYNYQTLHEVFS